MFLAVLSLLSFATLYAKKNESRIIPVETASSSLIFSVRDNGAVHQLHYGAKVDASEFSSVPMVNGRYGNGAQAYPATGGRYLGEPALHLRYSDGNHNTELVYDSHEVVRRDRSVTTSILLKDPLTGIRVILVYEAYPEDDVIVSHAEIENCGRKKVELLNFASAAMTLRSDKYLLTHVHGVWAQEMQLESELLGHDMKVIETRRQTQSTQCNNPSFLLGLGTSELDEDNGEVIAGALCWTGNFRLSFERDVEGRLTILSGINPFASTYPLMAGESFRTPDMIWSWSDCGAGGVSRNLHRWARKYGIYSHGRINPILLNSWEGAYFTFNTETIIRMIDDAASMGLEMFVLDDGWFGNNSPRNGDNAGLGDWQVNVSKLPEGID